MSIASGSGKTPGHVSYLTDFARDARGIPFQVINGRPQYMALEWFDPKDGKFLGPNKNSQDATGGNFFKNGMEWNPTTGTWENDTNWGNIIGLGTAGVIGGFGIAGLAGAGGAAGSGYGPLAGGYGGATTTATVPSSLAAVGGGSSVASYLTQASTISDLIRGGTSIWQALLQSGAAKDATEAQAMATKYAADLQKKAQDDQLAFLRQQAGYDATVAEANRSGNYQQWAARQEMLGPVGVALGLPARRIPAYVPLPANPYGTTSPTTTTGPTTPIGIVGGSGGTGGTTPPPTTAGAPGVSASNGDIRQQVADYYKARGVTPNPTSVDYWASKWNEFGAKDPAYFNQRLAIADEFGGGAPAPAAAPRRALPMSSDPFGNVANYLQDPAATPYDPPSLRQSAARPFYAGTVASYLA